MNRAATLTDADQYAADVLSGKIVACELVRLAAERYERERANPPDGYRFDERRAKMVIKFVQLLRHTKGGEAGKRFFIEPWQAFCIANLFGFVDDAGNRRYSKALVTVPRKNGKSTFAAALMLYLLMADGEPAADIYTAATKLDQARVIFDESFRMAQDLAKDLTDVSRELRFANSQNLKYIRYERSELRPLVAQDKTLDGLNPHAVAIDEYHAHRNDDLFNVLLTGMGARRQPLMLAVTTAGFNRNSPALKYQQYCEKVLRGTIDDPNTFALIYTLDTDDDWMDERNWVKANPNWGVSVQPKKLRQDFREAKEMAHKEVEFKTKYLNIWTDTAVTWIADRIWMQGDAPFTLADVAGMRCDAGLDLASTGDFTAFVRTFSDGDKVYVLPTFFLPEDAIAKRTDGTGDAIRQWVRDGYIIATPGAATDYRYLVDYIKDQHAAHPIDTIAYDRWNATQPVAMLKEAGLNMEPFGQGYAMMSAPTKEIERLANSGAIIHGGNPVLRWQMGNVMLTKDPAGNIKVDKAKSGDKVDGVVGMVMAMGSLLNAGLSEKPADFFVF
jgi:phage terminase large subunit-like protein